MSFILAGLVAVGTVCLAFLIMMATAMSDSPSTSISPFAVLIGGATITALLVASHWITIGW